MTDTEHDKQQLRKLFDTLKSLSEIEFKTDTGKEIKTGLQGAWNIVKPWIIELSHRIK